jgi:hypothetical protein
MAKTSVLRRAVAAAALLTVSATVAVAQLPGGFGRGRASGKMTIDPGIVVPKIVNPVNLLIEHRSALELSETQFARIIVIKRSLDSSNAPLMRRVDSVARIFKKGPLFADPSVARRDSLSAAHAVVRESIAGVEDNIADGKEKAFALLSSAQLTKAELIEDKARKAGGTPSRGRF